MRRKKQGATLRKEAAPLLFEHGEIRRSFPEEGPGVFSWQTGCSL